MIPIKWLPKQPVSPKINPYILSIFFILSTSSLAETLQPEMEEGVVLEALTLPVKDRVAKLKQSSRARDLLISIAFDQKKSLTTRWRAMTAMGVMGAKSFRWEIEGAMKSREWFMRNAGLMAIRYDNRERAIDWSKRLLYDPSLIVRTQATKNLIDLNAQEARESIWKAMQSPINKSGRQGLWVRGHMAKALAMWARNTDEKRFLKMLLDKDRTVQKWAIFGLENATGRRITSPSEPIEIQKQKWLSRLGGDKI